MNDLFWLLVWASALLALGALLLILTCFMGYRFHLILMRDAQTLQYYLAGVRIERKKLEALVTERRAIEAQMMARATPIYNSPTNKLGRIH